jgi:hypothetical protein
MIPGQHFYCIFHTLLQELHTLDLPQWKGGPFTNEASAIWTCASSAILTLFPLSGF